MLAPLKTLARDITGERKKHLTVGADLHRQFKNQMDNLERVSNVWVVTELSRGSVFVSCEGMELWVMCESVLCRL